MHIFNHFLINAAVGDVWNYFLDIPRMSVCIPGMRETVQVDSQTFTLVIDVRLAGMLYSFQGTISKTAQDPYQRLAASLQLLDPRINSVVTGGIEVFFSAETSDRTRVDYQVDLTLRGQLVQTDSALLNEAVQSIIQQFIQCARTRIEHPEEVSRPEASLSWSARISRMFQSLIDLIRQI